MKSTLGVYLHSYFVGEVRRLNTGRIQFVFDDSYLGDPNRPILSQSFFDEHRQVRNIERSEGSGHVPCFFANLLPEGELRSYLANLGRVGEHREFELLEMLGADLPGAVSVRRVDQTPNVSTGVAKEPVNFNNALNSDKPFRFSLAGVQLKFSVIARSRGGLTVPAQGVGGDWIAKLPSSSFKNVPANEYSMMALASAVGIDVPEVRLIPISDIDGLPSEIVTLDESYVFAIKRFDRVDGQRVHIEDFAQALSQRPEQKYNPQVNYANLTKLVASVCDEEDIAEFAKRLMFSAIIGNGDMHLKNWSLIYPDGRIPKLSPAYDFVCTTMYIPRDGLALKLGSARNWRDLTLAKFTKVADDAGVNRGMFVDAAIETVERFQTCWKDVSNTQSMCEQLRQRIATQIQICPAVKSAWQD